DDFARSGTGVGTQLTYPVTAWGYSSLWGVPLEDVRVGSDYRLEQAKISNISTTAPPSIRIEEGTSLISSVTPPPVAQHAEPCVRPDGGLAAGPLDRGGGTGRRAVHEIRGPRALVLHVLALEGAR